MELQPNEITKIIREQIKNYEHRLQASETGVVILVGDGIAKVSGLDNCMAGELVELSNSSFGMAQNLEEDTVSVIILGSDAGIKEGDTVKRTGRVVSVPVGELSSAAWWTRWASQWTARAPSMPRISTPSSARRRASSAARASACRCRRASRLSTA